MCDRSWKLGRWTCGVAAVCVAVTGCGRREEPPVPVPPPPSVSASTSAPPAVVVSTNVPPAVEPPRPVATQAVVAAAAPVPAATNALDGILELERRLEFTEALRRTEALRGEVSDPEVTRQLTDIAARLNQARRQATSLKYSIEALGSGDAAKVEVASRQLSNAGYTGLLYLRHAVREGAENVATGAAALLGELNDVEGAGAMLDRIRQGPRSDATVAAMRELRLMTRGLSSNDLATCHAILTADTAFDRFELTGVSEQALSGRCSGDPLAFSALMGRTQAVAEVRGYIDRVFVTGPTNAVRFVCANAMSFLNPRKELRGTGFADPGFQRPVATFADAAVRRDSSQPSRLPGNQGENLSLRWEGGLVVPADGDYTFYAGGDDACAVYLDEKQVVSASNADAASQPVRLSAGSHAIRIDLVQYGGPYRVVVEWSGPGIARTDRLPYTGAPTADDVLALAAAVRDLASTNAARLAAARELIGGAGDLGELFAGDAAVRHPPAVAIEALRILAGHGWNGAFGSLVERLRRETDPAFRQTAVEALGSLAVGVDAASLAPLVADLESDDDVRRAAAAGILCPVLDARCGGIAERFDELVGRPGTHARLSAFVRDLWERPDSSLFATYAGFFWPLVPAVAGVREQVYEGDDLDRLVLDRLGDQVWVDRDRLPVSTGALNNASARWSGWVNVPANGAYTFWIGTRQRAELSLDGKRLVAANGNDASAQPTLKAGLHAFELVYRQGGGDRWIDTWIEGPGVGRQRLGRDTIRTALWTDEWRALYAARDAVAKGGAPVADALARLNARDPASRLPLRNAVLHAPDPLLGAAVELLAYRQDRGLPEAVLARVRAHPEQVASGSLVAGAAAVPHAIATNEVAALVKALREGGPAAAPAMGVAEAALCAVAAGVCGGRADEFNRLAGGDDGAWATVKERVEAALASADRAVVGRAAVYGTPFAESMHGWRARYYEGWDPGVPVLERRDAVPYQEQGKFPHPTNRQDQVCAVWTGRLHIPQKGVYTFRTAGRSFSRLWVDGRVAVESGWNEAAATLDLVPGPHDLRYEFHHATGDSSHYLHWEGPGIGRQGLAAPWVTTPPWPAAVDAALEGVALLRNGQDKGRAAVDALDAASPVVLRYAARHLPLEAALPALTDLRLQVGPQAAPLAMARLKANPDDRAGAPLVDLLEQAAEALTAEDAAWVWARRASAKGPARQTYTALACALAERRCGGDAGAFDALVGVDGAAKELAAEIGAAVRSRDAATVAWALEHGGPWAPRAGGWRGRYYAAGARTVPSLERRDWQPTFQQNAFPVEPRTNTLACWTGMLRVDAEGDFVFFARADDGVRIDIDGKTVLDAWRYATAREVSATLKLSRGWHAVAVTYWQASGDHYLGVAWQGPGIGRSELRGDWVQMHLDAADVKALQADMAKVAVDGGEGNEARQRIRGRGDAGQWAVANAIRYGDAATAAYASRVLVEWRAWPLVEAAAQRLAAEKDEALRGQLDAALTQAGDAMPEAATAVVPTLLADDRFALREAVRFLGAVMARKCGGDAGRFDGMAGRKDATASLKDYVRRAAASDDAAVAAWAAAYTGPFKP